VTSLRTRALKIAPAIIRRLARAYGTEAQIILARGHLGRIFGADLGEYEVAFLMEKEWARTADDILWRRSKLGLRFAPDEVAALTRYMEDVLKQRDTV
jgi:glycerol-3-phosphate dehydrogenase